MGKGLRSNSKKAVRRSRRTILLKECSSLRKNEEQKQELLERILNQPKPPATNHNVSHPGRESRQKLRRGRLGSDDEGSVGDRSLMQDIDRPAVNITQTNAMRRHRRRSKYLRRSLCSNQFVVTECERRRIAQRREKANDTKRIEASLGLKKEKSTTASDEGRMEISKSDICVKQPRTKRLAPGSQWLKIKKLTGSRRFSKRPLRRRYRMELKGITQYYPVKQEEMAVDE